MTYEKDNYIEGYKISLLLKQSGEVSTYRVRDTEGKLCVLKWGISKSELSYAPLSGLFISKGGNYVVYRYVSGETLEARLLRLNKLKEEETIRLAKDILKQLIKIHQNGFVHLNLTPDNIVVELGGESPVAYIVGLSQLQPISQSGINKDLCGVGSVICQMLTGGPVDRIKVNVGKCHP